MVNIRQAGTADLDVVAALFDQYRQFYQQASDPAGARAFLAARMERGESIVLIAEVLGEGVGFTQLYPTFSSVNMSRVWILNDLFVRGDARGRGIARALLAAATGQAELQGARRLSLSTARDNHVAQALYQSDGWVRDDVYLSYSKALAKP